MLLKCFPLFAVQPVVFLALFLLIDKKDEFQVTDHALILIDGLTDCCLAMAACCVQLV